MDNIAGRDKKYRIMGSTACSANLYTSLFCAFNIQLHDVGFYVSSVLNVGVFLLDNEPSLVITRVWIGHSFSFSCIDLYHTAAILSPRRTKNTDCFCPSSLALYERLDGQNLLFQHCAIMIYWEQTTLLLGENLGRNCHKALGHSTSIWRTFLWNVTCKTIHPLVQLMSDSISVTKVQDQEL